MRNIIGGTVGTEQESRNHRIASVVLSCDPEFEEVESAERGDEKRYAPQWRGLPDEKYDGGNERDSEYDSYQKRAYGYPGK